MHILPFHGLVRVKILPLQIELMTFLSHRSLTSSLGVIVILGIIATCAKNPIR